MPRLSAKEKKQHAKVRAAETRRDKFERLAQRRVNRALTAIRLLGNLASSNYQWDLADIRYIRTSINKVMDQTFTKFEVRRAPSPADEFSFDTRRSPRHISEDVPTDWERWKDQVQSPVRSSPQEA